MDNLKKTKLPISVFIITKNEEERLVAALESVKDLADEIIIVDSGSTDHTLELAKKYTKKIKYKKWEGFGQQKSYAESLCKNDWILNIDADERLSPKLQEEIKEIFKQGQEKKYSGFYANKEDTSITCLWMLQSACSPLERETTALIDRSVEPCAIPITFICSCANARKNCDAIPTRFFMFAPTNVTMDTLSTSRMGISYKSESFDSSIANDIEVSLQLCVMRLTLIPFFASF